MTRPRVVPHEGTWIEMTSAAVYAVDFCVVPHEGTWIEIAVAAEVSHR